MGSNLFQLGQGTPKDVTVADPAAGLGFSLTAPVAAGDETGSGVQGAKSGRRWRLLFMYAKFVTAGGGGNRVAAARIVTSASVIEFQATSPTTIAGGVTTAVSLAPISTNSPDVIALPNDTILSPGDSVTVFVTGIAGGDQFSNIAAKVEEFWT